MGSEIEMKAKLKLSLVDTIEKIEKSRFNMDGFVKLYKQDAYYSIGGEKPKDISDAVRIRKEGDLGSKKSCTDAEEQFLLNHSEECDNVTYSLTMKEKEFDGFVENNKEYETTFKKPEVIHKLLEKAGYKQYFNKIKKSIGTYVFVNDGPVGHRTFLHTEFVNVSSNGKESGIYLETEATFEDDVPKKQYEYVKSLLNELYETLDLTDNLDSRSWASILS